MKVETYTQEAKNNYRNELKRLEEANQRLISSKETQLDHLKKSYEKRADIVRSMGEEHLVDLKNDLNAKQQQELSNNQEILSRYQDHLKQTQDQLEKQRNDLQVGQQLQMKQQQSNFADTVNTRQAELSEQIAQINDRSNEKVIDVIQKSDQLMSEQNFNARSKIDTNERQNDSKLREQARQFEIKKRDEVLTQYQESANAKLVHDREMANQFLKNSTEMTLRESNFQKQISTQDSFYSQKIKDQHEAFKQKMAALSQEQEQLIKTVTSKFHKDIEDMVSNHSVKKRDLASKQMDEFYHVSTIEPKITETENSYLVSVKLPEHEKDGARLTAHDRTVRLNFTRNFDDKVTDDSGSTYSSKRSEVMSKEFNVNSIVESKNITQKYADGVLTFILPKK